MTGPGDWKVRPATGADAERLALVGSATFLESFAGVIDGDGIVAHCRNQHSAQRYADYLDQGAKAWLAEIAPGAAPVGYALTCAPDLPQAQDGDIELKRIYVLSQHHGSGIAAALLSEAVAAATGHARMLLGVYNGNARALTFYKKHRFAVIGDRRFDVGGHTYEDFVLARTLTSDTQ
ncbi:MAG: N-acetyltransferase [Sphingomonadaceae bacterium]